MGILFDKYLIDMTKEEDSVAWKCNADNTLRVSKFTPAFFPDGRDEIGEIVMMHGKVSEKYHHDFYEVFYHEHLDGAETFFVTDGEFEAISMGEKMLLHPGDVMHVQPFMGHGFRALGPYGRLLVMFQSKNMRVQHEHIVNLNANFPEIAADPKFKAKQMEGQHDMVRDGSYYYDIAPETTTSPSYRCFGKGIRSHDLLPGTKLNLIIARYETHGIKEVWEAEMQKGVRMENNAVRYDHRLFWVRKGHIKFNIDGTEFVAYPNCLVYVPPYHCFTFETEEEANLVDLSCPYYLQDLLEELRLIKSQYPEKMKDDAALNELFARCKADRIKYSFNG